MNSVPDDKLVVAEFRRIDLDQRVSLAQQVCGFRLLNTSVPLYSDPDSFNYLANAKDAAATRIALTDGDFDKAWDDFFEEGVVEQVVCKNLIDWLLGIAVFEVVLHGKRGILKNHRKARFLVIQNGVKEAVFVTDSIESAVSTAKRLAANQAVDPSVARRAVLPKGFALKRRR